MCQTNRRALLKHYRVPVRDRCCLNLMCWISSLCKQRRVDETYLKVGAQWVYLYRSVDEQGKTVDSYLESHA
jgi:transposase-like protein